MTDRSMIERVARAICREYSDFQWYLYVPEARAVIEAMREPTSEMVKAGLRCGDTGSEPALSVWRAIIDAALKEETK